MKKILALLLILLVSVQAVAAAEAVGDAQAAPETPVTLIIRVVDGQGNPLVGAQVTVRGYNTGELVHEYTVDATGIATIDTLPTGVYTAKAVDPSDGYSAAESFNLLSDTAIDLVVRKLL